MKEFSSDVPEAITPPSPFADLEAAAHEHLSSLLTGISARHEHLVRRAQQQLTDRWNEIARRLRTAETPAKWRAVLLEAARPFCAAAAVFRPEDAAAAPALAAVVESRDTVVALRDASQLSEALLASAGPSGATRCYLFPVFAGSASRAPVAVILYADGGAGPDPDRSALELLAALAAGTQAGDPEPVEPPAGFAAIAPLRSGGKPRWAPSADAPRHYAAQRFARVRIAEWLLHDREAVARGRGANRIYRELEQPFEAARREFRARFVELCPSMADYLHEEAVSRLAYNDVARMGSEYPGPLVL